MAIEQRAPKIIERFNTIQGRLGQTARAIYGDRGWFYIVQDNAVKRRVNEGDFLKIIEAAELEWGNQEDTRARTHTISVRAVVTYQTNIYVPPDSTLETVTEQWAETIRSNYGRGFEAHLTDFRLE